jgi:hypothetical protein
MSVVALRKYPDKLVVGSDSILITNDALKDTQELGKLFRSQHGLIIGSCGLALECSLMKLFVENLKIKSLDESVVYDLFVEFEEYIRDRTNNPEHKLENDYLIAYGDQAFFFGEYFVMPVTEYYAIGAGCEVAMGALHTGATVQQALEAACDLNIRCSRPLKIFEARFE